MCSAPNGTNLTYCCIYQRTKILGIESKTWTCGPMPVETEADSTDNDVADALGAEYEAYCDNALLMKVSIFVASLAALFAF